MGDTSQQHSPADCRHAWSCDRSKGKSGNQRQRTPQKNYDKEKDTLLQKFVDDNTGAEVSSPPRKHRKWRGYLLLLAYTFVDELKGVLKKGVRVGLDDILDESLRLAQEKGLAGLLPTDKKVREVMYYVAGWLSYGLSLEAKSRGAKPIARVLRNCVEGSTITRASATDANLPVGKTVKQEAFGGLKYLSERFFCFVSIIEYVFSMTLNEHNQIMYRGGLIRQLRVTIESHPLIQQWITRFNVPESWAKDVTAVLMEKYARMRGKDCVRKMLAVRWKAPQVGTRQKTAVLSNPEAYRAVKVEDKKEAATAKMKKASTAQQKQNAKTATTTAAKAAKKKTSTARVKTVTSKKKLSKKARHAKRKNQDVDNEEATLEEIASALSITTADAAILSKLEKENNKDDSDDDGYGSGIDSEDEEEESNK